MQISYHLYLLHYPYLACISYAPEYNTWVKNIFFTDLPNAIANVTQRTASSSENVWDNMMSNASKRAFKAADEAGWLEVGGLLLTGLLV